MLTAQQCTKRPQKYHCTYMVKDCNMLCDVILCTTQKATTYYTVRSRQTSETQPTQDQVNIRGVARNLIWVGINCTILNLSWVKETKQPHKKLSLIHI